MNAEYDRKGRPVCITEFVVKDSLAITQSYYYKKDTTVIEYSANKLVANIFRSMSLQNGISTVKDGKSYKARDETISWRRAVKVSEKGIVRSVLIMDKNNDIVSSTRHKYDADGRILSIATDGSDGTLEEQIDYQYSFGSKNGEYSVMAVKKDRKLITKEEKIFDGSGLLQKTITDIFHRSKRIDARTTVEYFYKDYSRKEESLYQVKQTDSLENLFVKETLTSYYQDKLVKDIRTDHISDGQAHSYFEYDFDRSGNWTARYHFNAVTEELAQIESREIKYY